MRSVVRSVRKRKKARVLGEVQVVRREEYAGLEVDTKVELIRALVPLGLMHVQQLLEDEVEALVGARYARPAGRLGTRHGSNPGTVRLAGQRVPIRVPRVRGHGGELPLRSYAVLHGSRGEIDALLLRRVLYGISCRNYEAAAAAVPGAIGLSSSTVSRRFVVASAAQLQAFQERELHGEDLVAVFLDGKTFADTTLVIAMGVRATGEKRFLGFVETDTENEAVLTPFLRSLLERGLDITRGLLVVVDGGKGLRAAVRKAFKALALVQRCQWHKRENVVRYLPKREQATWRRRLQRAYDRPTYAEARAALQALYAELAQRNQSAAASLAEGLEETLTLHRLGLYGVLGRSLKTTNCLESVNAIVEARCAKVDCWKTSGQKHRWLATALLDIEPRMRRIKGYVHLPTLRAALQRELKIGETKIESVEEAA
jgi:transposase-like protein